MSAFAVIYERSNTPGSAGVLERVMERLKHRGPNGSEVLLAGHVALGHWHFWTTPEEVGEKQPLKLEEGPFQIVLDGRLDNRLELLSKLSINPAGADHLSDAALVLRAYARWGADCLQHFIGEFAFAIFDERRAELFCARDALGDRTLFYSHKGTHFVAASEPWAVAGADESAAQLNETAVAYYFALKATEDGQTFFKNVYELLPAHGMIVSAGGLRQWRYWKPDPSVRLRGRSDNEYAEQFIFLLDESVRCRLRSTTPVGVLMSGGLDSTSVACLAARMLEPKTLTTISYVFDELTDCDERGYINAVKERWDTRSIQIPCDDAWPLKNWQNWPRNPNQPQENAYRMIKERVYQEAQKEGLRVLLTGMYGDELYGRGIDWLSDLILDGRILQAGGELFHHFRYANLQWNLRAGYMQRVARRLLNTLPGGKRLRRRANAPAWLTPSSTAALSKTGSGLDPAFEQLGSLLDLQTARDCSGEIFNANRYMLELRHPYRDRRLIEFVLTLPAYQLYNHGLYKHILRIGMKDILPETIRTRYQPTQFRSLLRRGFEREKNVLQTCIHSPDAAWRAFVNADWLLPRWENPITADSDVPQALVPWMCVAYEAWLQAPVL